MAGTITESVRGPIVTVESDKATLERAYTIMGESNEETALTLLITTAPAVQTVNGIVLAKKVYRLELDGTIFRCVVEYSRLGASDPSGPDPLPEGTSTFQFETGGGTTHITHSLDTKQSERRNSATAIDFKNAIGFNGNTVAGVDVVTPVFTFSETHALSEADVTGPYKSALFRATGKVNNGSFKGFAAGEVLFLGATGQKRGDGPWEVTYRFAASENATAIGVGDITGVNKKGWEYLWTYFEDSESENVLVAQPEQVNVEEVYESHNFANIGIGTF